jgi:hypothetical protein
MEGLTSILVNSSDVADFVEAIHLKDNKLDDNVVCFTVLILCISGVKSSFGSLVTAKELESFVK